MTSTNDDVEIVQENGLEKSSSDEETKLDSNKKLASDSETKISSENDEDKEKEEKKDEWQDLIGSGGILKKVIKEGKPDSRPQRMEQCTINYTCTLEDGTIVEKEDNFVFTLGDCELVQGLDVSISLMNLHEKSLIKLQPRLAFGSKGLPPKIPPDTDILYEVELIDVNEQENIDSLSIKERKIKGNKKRERGNWWYSRGENNLAIHCYRRALDYLDEVEGGIKYPTENGEATEVSDSDLQSILEDRINVCNNMAAAQIKLELYDAALTSLQTVLRCQPNNIKALFRKATIYKEKNDLSSAMKCLQKANELSPNNSDIQKQITYISQKLQKQKVTERELARRMFSAPKVEQKTVSKAKKIGLWMTIGATIAVGVVGVVAYRLKFT